MINNTENIRFIRASVKNLKQTYYKYQHSFPGPPDTGAGAVLGLVITLR